MTPTNRFSPRAGQNRSLVLFLFTLVLLTTWTQAENWPQWRGPEGLGISREQGLPWRWDQTTNILWKTPLEGEGHSSPIVWEDHVFLTVAIKGSQVEGPQAPAHQLAGKPFVHPDWVGSDFEWTLKVLAFDRKTGKLLWERTSYQGTVRDHRHRKNTYASSTPVTDGVLVYGYFGSEGLYAYDFQGNLVWSKQFGLVNTVGLGTATSPILHGDNLIVTCDQSLGEPGSFMVALNKSTGEEQWRVDRPTIRVSWVTPLIVRRDDRTEMIVAGTEQIISYDPQNGHEFWRCQGVESGMSTPAVPTPVADQEKVFVSVGIHTRRAIAIELGGQGDVTDSPRVLWQHHGGTGDIPSPLLYGDHFYLVSDGGIVTNLDSKSGKLIYRKRLPVSTYIASPIAFEDKILFSNEDGQTIVIAAGPDFTVLADNSLDEPILASLAASEGMLVIRTAQHLYGVAN